MKKTYDITVRLTLPTGREIRFGRAFVGLLHGEAQRLARYQWGEETEVLVTEPCLVKSGPECGPDLAAKPSAEGVLMYDDFGPLAR